MTQAMEAQKQAIKNLLELGKKQGKLTLKQMADALSEIDLDSDQLDRLYETLEKLGVEIQGADTALVAHAEEEFPEHPAPQDVQEEEQVDPDVLAEGFAIDVSSVDMKTGCPPSSPNAVSKDERVRVERFSKIRAIVFPRNLW